MIKIYNDIGESWNMSFQEEGTPIAAGIIDLHNKLMYYLIIILTIIFYITTMRIINNGYINRIKYFNEKSTKWIEFIWTIIPAIILIIIAIPSFKLLFSLEAEENNTPKVTVKITGNQWFWNYEISDFAYSDGGKKEGKEINFDSYTIIEEDLNKDEFRLLEVDNRLILPIYTPIRILVTAQDVIHSWYVPSLAIKIDAIPGRLNHYSLYILRPGLFTGQCAELCGNSHSQMSILVEGVESKNYLKWLSSF